MKTDCNSDWFGFELVEGHPVVAAFDGGSITSDAGALLLGASVSSRRAMRSRAGRTRRSGR
jgi:hypothetical protein